jgi:hypothetical protein
MLFYRTTLLVSFLSLFIAAHAQPSDLSGYTSGISAGKLQSSLSFISDDLTKGRAAGTPGSIIVSSYLRGEFERLGMIPFYSRTFTQSFGLPDNGEGSSIGRNIIGVLPSLYYTDEYILITAHYDHLGVLGGRIYNGADDNASGVASLLSIASLFSEMRNRREGPRKNIIFALFDAKEVDLAGSQYFVKHIPVPVSKIKYAINIDQIGCTFAPPGKFDDYILYVADSKIRAMVKKLLEDYKNRYRVVMDINHTFYGSEAFYDVFLKTSDNYNLSKAGIPSMMFTSGIHMHTYKHTDDHYFINYPVLYERIKLMFLFTCGLLTK